MSYGKTLAYAWKSVGAEAMADNNRDAYLNALQQVIDQVRTLPPDAVLATPVNIVDDGQVQDNDGTMVYVFHWELTYSIPS